MEHYEIIWHGSVPAFAERTSVNILSTTLEEERSADEKLTDLAVTVINVSPAVEGGNSTLTQIKSVGRRVPGERVPGDRFAQEQPASP